MATIDETALREEALTQWIKKHPEMIKAKQIEARAERAYLTGPDFDFTGPSFLREAAGLMQGWLNAKESREALEVALRREFSVHPAPEQIAEFERKWKAAPPRGDDDEEEDD